MDQGAAGSASSPDARKRIARAVAGLVCSGLAVWLLLRQVSLTDVAERLAHAGWGWVAAALGVKVAVVVLRQRRWLRVLEAMGPGPYPGSFRALCAGYLGNLILPFKLGEVVRVVLLRQRNPRVGFGEGLATAAAERILDVGVLALMAAGALLFVQAPAWLSRGTAAVAAALVPAIALAASGSLQRAFERRLPRGRAGDVLRRVVAALAAGSRVLRRPRDLAAAVTWTGAAWACEALAVWLIVLSVGDRIAYPGALVTTLFVALGQVIPSAPAQLGTHQVLAVLFLEPFGVLAPQAVAVSLLLQSCNLVLFGVTGGEALLSFGFGRHAPDDDAG